MRRVSSAGPRPSTLRNRAMRARRRGGVVRCTIELRPDDIAGLVANGYLWFDQKDDPQARAGAVRAVMRQALTTRGPTAFKKTGV